MIALPLLTALLWTASGDVVARVDGQAITADDVARRLAAASGPARPEQVVSSLVDEALLTAEGRRLGLDRSPAAAARLDVLERKEASALFLQREFSGRASPDEKTLRAVFHATADFVAFDLLAFATAEDAAGALARIRGGAAWAAEGAHAVLARVHENPAAAPLVMRAELPAALADALFGATDRTPVGPVPLPEGFGIARVHRKVVGSDADFATQRAALTARAREQAVGPMKQHALARLRERAGVKVDEAFLRSVDTLEPTSAQLEHEIAHVGGKPLRLRDIIDDVRALRAAGGHMGPSLRISLAWNAVDDLLVEKVAVERGLLQDPAIVALRPRLAAEATGYAAAVRVMDGAPAPTKAEIESYYERNAPSFGKPLRDVRAQAASGAAREKRFAALGSTIAALRQKATISIDPEALARASKSRP